MFTGLFVSLEAANGCKVPRNNNTTRTTYFTIYISSYVHMYVFHLELRNGRGSSGANTTLQLLPLYVVIIRSNSTTWCSLRPTEKKLVKNNTYIGWQRWQLTMLRFQEESNRNPQCYNFKHSTQTPKIRSVQCRQQLWYLERSEGKLTWQFSALIKLTPSGEVESLCARDFPRSFPEVIKLENLSSMRHQHKDLLLMMICYWSAQSRFLGLKGFKAYKNQCIVRVKHT